MNEAASVKWYDKFNRLFSKNFDTVDAARTFFWALHDSLPIYARFVAFTTEGTIVLGECRS